jgi:hypothetical protein
MARIRTVAAPAAVATKRRLEAPRVTPRLAYLFLVLRLVRARPQQPQPQHSPVCDLVPI